MSANSPAGVFPMRGIFADAIKTEQALTKLEDAWTKAVVLYEPDACAGASLPVLHLWPERLEISMKAFTDEYRPTLIRLQIRIYILRKFHY